MFSIPIDDFHECAEMIHVYGTKVAFRVEGALRLGRYNKEPRAK